MSRCYWLVSVEESISDRGVSATKEQIESIAVDMRVSHEQFGMSQGHDVACDNLRHDRERQVADLRKLHGKEMLEMSGSHQEEIDRLERMIRDLSNRLDRAREMEHNQ